MHGQPDFHGDPVPQPIAVGENLDELFEVAERLAVSIFDVRQAITAGGLGLSDLPEYFTWRES